MKIKTFEEFDSYSYGDENWDGQSKFSTDFW
jgi:hypothetical protein